MSKGILCCPVCGSTNLAIEAVVKYVQNEEGDWEVEDMDIDAMRDTLLGTHSEVYCENECCGTPYKEGVALPLEGGETVIEFWFRVNQLGPVDLSSLSPEQTSELDSFLASIQYEPWQGTVGECVELDR